MTLTLGNLNLGVVGDLSLADRKRLEDMDLPSARGSSSQDLGELASALELQGAFVGANRFDDFRQLQRYKRLGNSLKFDADAAKTVVFIREVKLTKIEVNILRYSLSLKESLFKQINSCDEITSWLSSTVGATVEAVPSVPTPLEGLNCIKVSHDAEAAEEVNVTYEPFDSVDLQDFDWLTFAWLMSNLSEITSAVITVTEGLHNATFNFSGLLTEAEKWLRLRIHKTSFTDYGALDWGQIDKIKLAIAKSQAQNYYFAVDDVGGFE